MKRFLNRWKVLCAGALVLLLGLIAYAESKKDPLLVRLQQVSIEFLGARSFPFSSNSTPGLFWPDIHRDETATVPIQGHEGYQTAISHLKELKALIEEESGKRSKLSLGGEKYQNLVAAAAGYVELQKAIYLNFAANVHELGASPKAVNIDELNLKVDVNVGGQLLIATEHQKKYSIRHLPEDRALSKVELFIPPYERLQLEVAALSRVKTKAEYQKMIHLMHLRDSLVNRWAISRVSQSVLQEARVNPPSLYASFADDLTGKPSQFRFFKDLGVEDLYQERILSQLEGLSEKIKDSPLGSPTEYRRLVSRFYQSFAELDGVLRDDFYEDLVASIYHVEESTLAGRASQVILESSFPQDDLSPAEIARRLATIAFAGRKSSVITSLLRHVRIDLAAVRELIEANEEGVISEGDQARAEQYTRLPAEDLKRADRVLDDFFISIETAWKEKFAQKIIAHYAKSLPNGVEQERKERYREFFNRTLEDAVDGVLGQKQVQAYQTIQRKLLDVPSSTVSSLDSGIPKARRCISNEYGGPSHCTHQVAADDYLWRLDAEADLGLKWVVPWTPGQVTDIFSKKIENMKASDPASWKKIQSAVDDKILMKQVSLFFGELERRHQAAIQEKQKSLSMAIMAQDKLLAARLRKSPTLDRKATPEYRKILALQERMEAVGVAPDESVLSESMYQDAAHKVFSSYLKSISPKAPDPNPASSEERVVSTRFHFPDPYQYRSPRDGTSLVAPVSPSPEIPQLDGRVMRAVELGKLFSLLGFGWEFFSRYSDTRHWDGRVGVLAQTVKFEVMESLLPKPSALDAGRLGGVVRSAPRKPKAAAISEISRTAAAQKFLGESIMATAYTRVPFLRIQEGESEQAPTGLERLAGAYLTATHKWNRDQAHAIFQSLLATALRNDQGKVEDAVRVNPILPGDETWRRIFRLQAHNRALFIATADQAKRRLEVWEKELKSELRTTVEKWNDRMSIAASVLFLGTLGFLFFEFLVWIPALGLSSIAGTLIGGILGGSNLLVQGFFVTLLMAQGQVAFFTLPAHLRYQKEVANSTVGQTSPGDRVLPSERVSRENIQALQDEVRITQVVTGVFAVVQGAFLPMQIKQLSRGFGHTGKVALSRLGRANPGLAESMKAYSLLELVENFGYAKGSKIYFERFAAALAMNKAVSSVNGGATLVQAQKLLAESLAATIRSPAELAALLEHRLAFLNSRILTLHRQADKYFAVTQGAQMKDLLETVRLHFGAELSTLGFKLNSPQVRIYIRSRIAQAIEAGSFSEIESGTEKYLLKAFLLRLKAEKLAFEAIELGRALQRSKEILGRGVATGTHEVFAEMVGLQNLVQLDDLLKWAARHPEYQNSPFGELLKQARQSSKDYKVIADDILRLSKKEQATYEAMKGKADVIVEDDLTLRLGEGQTVDPASDEFFIQPGLGLGLRPENY
jgi:hypothetical protein